MNELDQKIIQKLEELREQLQSHGGDLEVIQIDGKIVRLRLQGACGCCPHAMMTIKNNLEVILREEVDPELTIERVL